MPSPSPFCGGGGFPTNTPLSSSRDRAVLSCAAPIDRRTSPTGRGFAPPTVPTSDAEAPAFPTSPRLSSGRCAFVAVVTAALLGALSL